MNTRFVVGTSTDPHHFEYKEGRQAITTGGEAVGGALSARVWCARAWRRVRVWGRPRRRVRGPDSGQGLLFWNGVCLGFFSAGSGVMGARGVGKVGVADPATAAWPCSIQPSCSHGRSVTRSDRISLYHYATKSLEEYQAKMARGGVAGGRRAGIEAPHHHERRVARH